MASTHDGTRRRRAPNAQTDARLAGGLLVLLLGMTGVALTYPPVTRTFPVLVGVSGSLLSAVEYIRLRRRARASPRSARESQRARVLMFGWVSVALASVAAIGLPVGSALFVGAFLRFRGRESWTFSVIGAAAIFVVLHVVLERALGLPLYPGLVR